MDRSYLYWGVGGVVVSLLWLTFTRPALAKIPSSGAGQ